MSSLDEINSTLERIEDKLDDFKASAWTIALGICLAVGLLGLSVFIFDKVFGLFK